MRTTLAIMISALLLISGPNARPADSAVANFNALTDKFLDFFFPLHPSFATSVGFHQFDTKLEDFTAAGQEELARGLKEYLAKFEAVDRAKLPQDTAADLDWMIAAIRGELLEIEDIQQWRKDPENYSGGVTNSIFLIMKRNFAPPEDRLRSVIARESQIPNALEAARQNLQNPPKIYVEIALEQLPDETDFYRKDVRDACSAVKDPKLLAAFKGLTTFIAEKKIITIPAGPPPILEDTPPFMRATTSASMDTPGAYETKTREAFFNVTEPDPKWPADRTEQWMESFNNSMIPGTAIHEVYPGHYVQFLWINQLHIKVRKLFFCGSNAEGWAHYSEQMMLDEGYGNGDPVLRMGQLEDALLRNACFIVGIQMHTGNMTLDQARDFFIKEGYQLPPVADVETKRGTSDPTYLVYTLGKLQILKLREDYRKMRGKDFTLLDFHDKFMQQGGVPLKIVRKAMLGDDSPTL